MSRFKAVVFDWAGTMIDYGSFAPMGVFVEAFRQFGIDVTIEEARAPMGAPKWDHIRAMMDQPRIASAWEKQHGRAPDDDDVTHVYNVFVPMNEAVVADYATLVPGAKDTVDWLRKRGLKIGSTTGYTRSIMERVLPAAKAQGYEPDNLVCAGDLPEGRPGPLMMYKCFIDLAVYPPSRVIKVDDTEPGILEGKAAGCVTVGVTLSGNHVGRPFDEVSAMSKDEAAALHEKAAKVLHEAGADHVIETVADLPALIEQLEADAG